MAIYSGPFQSTTFTGEDAVAFRRQIGELPEPQTAEQMLEAIRLRRLADNLEYDEDLRQNKSQD